MNQKDNKSSEPRPRYVWDPKKLEWVQTTDAGAEEAVIEEATVEPAHEKSKEEVAVESHVEEVSDGFSAIERTPVLSTLEEGLKYRGAWIRLLAFIVDIAVLLLVSFIITRITGINTAINTASGEAPHFSTWQQWLFAAFIFFYFVGFWAWRGQTPGKMLIGAKIVKKDGSSIGLVRALLRFIVYFLYLLVWGLVGTSFLALFLIIVVAFIIVAFNRKKRGLHDFVAGTVVINTRAKAPEPVLAETSELAESPGTSETDKQE
jgi:uncharacterized RDD family membrane protein YckC